MTARSISMGAPFRWLTKSLDVGRRNPGALFGGFALMLAVGLVPSLVQAALQYGLKLSPEGMLPVYLGVMALSLALLPPLTGGAFRLLHASETGRPASATDVFAGYRDLGLGLRLVLASLALVALYALAFALLYALLPGKEFFVEVIARAAVTPPGGQPDMTGLPEAPASFLLWLLGAGLVVVVLGHAYMLAFAQVALADRGPLRGIGEGLAGTLRNLLPLIGVSIVVGIVGMVLLFLAALVLGLALALLMSISPVLAFVVGLPVYLLLALGFYVVAFGFYYHAWAEIFGTAELPPPAIDAIAA